MTATKLGKLRKGQRGTILSIGADIDDDVSQRLIQMGILEGAKVEVLHEAPTGDPIAIKVRGALIALGRDEANRIEVQEIE